MRPTQIEQVGNELAIKWEDGQEDFIQLEKLRRQCPCAGCRGEADIMGNVSKGPEKPLIPASFELRRLGWVGGYGVQPYWGDGHSSGIFTFELLKSLAGLEQ